jgi:DNA-binding XRE family transcriptional regulator
MTLGPILIAETSFTGNAVARWLTGNGMLMIFGIGGFAIDRRIDPTRFYPLFVLTMIDGAKPFEPWSADAVQETFLRRIKERILADEHPISVWRMERVMTSAQLAKRAKIEPDRLAAIERELVSPSTDELARLADVLRAPPELLLVEQDGGL